MTCPDCMGEGMVTKMEYVYSGEPHMADIGSQKCPRCLGTGEVGEDEVDEEEIGVERSLYDDEEDNIEPI